MTGGWQIFLFLFILGVVCGSLNEMGIFASWTHLPDTAYTIGEEQIAATGDSVVNQELDALLPIKMLISFVKILVSGVVAVFSLGALFWGLGVPMNAVTIGVLAMIQVTANLIAVFWLFELVTGRSVG